jgi:hypothetical protein
MKSLLPIRLIGLACLAVSDRDSTATPAMAAWASATALGARSRTMSTTTIATQTIAAAYAG